MTDHGPAIVKRFTIQGPHPRGHILLCFVADVVTLPEDDPRLAMHSILWEARALALMLLEFGFDLDVLDIRKGEVPADHPPYKAIISLHNDLYRHKARLEPATIKIALLTGSSPDFQMRREDQRIAALRKRRTGAYAPKRRVPFVDQELFSYHLADHCLLIGNQTTLSTYPESLRGKMTLVEPTISWPLYAKPAQEFVPDGREFLWLGNIGAVLKGLDLVLEIFGRHPEWTLNIVGTPGDEADFVALYRHELFECPNIRLHGLQQLAAPEMQEIARRCFAFVSPAASEGMSTSAAACLAMGLYPIISKECGIDLPMGLGTILESCAIDEIEDAVALAQALPHAELAAQISALQTMALRRFSRAAFLESRRRHLGSWLGVL